MAKNIVVKIIIAILVLILLYSVFWFFKAGQLEKTINNFVQENSAFISSAKVKVTGYPFSQKASVTELKFILPNSALSKNRISISQLDIQSSIFSGNFSVKINGAVTLQDNDDVKRVDFNSSPEMSLKISDGNIINFSYKDSGYRVFDSKNNKVFSSDSTSISVNSSREKNDQINTKIKVDVLAIQGFNIIDIYKNSFEKKIIDGIKTGEIKIGTPNLIDAQTSKLTLGESESPSIFTAPTPYENKGNSKAQEIITNINNEEKKAMELSQKYDPKIAKNIKENSLAIEQQAAIQEGKNNPENTIVSEKNNEIETAILKESEIISSNISIDIDYVLSPNKSNQQMTSPLDPSQLQMATTQYNKNFKINLIEISNQNFKISIMGSVDQFQDDSMLSGFASIKIQKLDNLVSYLKSEFKNISQAIKSTVKDSSDASQAMQANSSDGQNISVDQNAQVINGTAENKQANSLDQDRGGDYSLLQYSKSLDQIIENMEKVSQEISSKNQLSQNGDCVLDIKRERNLELIINDISVREILGKF